MAAKKTTIPPNPKATYNEEFWGIYGEVGTGQECVRFLQGAFSVKGLPKLTLVADLPGSEKWPIQQLFQRDIDVGRVTEEIIPYFKRTGRIKFFNPLTLAALPIGPNFQVKNDIAEIDTVLDGDPGDVESWRGFEAHGFYRAHHSPDGNWTRFNWNSAQTKIVAIDGQHRLSALQRLYQEYERDPDDSELNAVDFGGWRIPVILILAPPSKKLDMSISLLEKVRDIFVTINKEAKKPTRCRTILLNDYSVSALCCQKLLDDCHNRGAVGVPLMFFDWRAKEEQDNPESPVAFMRVEELEDIHINYILGKDGEGGTLTNDQRNALFVADMQPPLKETDPIAMRHDIRKRYAETLMPAVLALLSDFAPLKNYVDALRTVMKSANNDVRKHALSLLIYGKHHAAPMLESDVRAVYDKWVATCNTVRSSIPMPFDRLVGTRGIFCGLYEFREACNVVKIEQWADLAEKYVKKLNQALKKKAFDKALLRHLVFDHNDNVVNYRPDQIFSAFGAYCGLVAISYQFAPAEAKDAKAKLLGEILKTLKRGFRREVKPAILEKNTKLTKEQLAALVNDQAEKKAKAQLNKIRKDLGLLATQAAEIDNGDN